MCSLYINESHPQVVKSEEDRLLLEAEAKKCHLVAEKSKNAPFKPTQEITSKSHKLSDFF